MNNFTYYKRKFYFTLIILLILGIGIGYAVLSQRLSVGSTVNYGSMKWDVGFTSVVDMSGVVYPDTFLGIGTISNDKKSATITCDMGTITKSVTCTTAFIVSNNSTFDVILDSIDTGSSIPNLTNMSKYIKDRQITVSHDVGGYSILETGYVLKAGESKKVTINYDFNELTEDLLPENGLSFNFEVSFTWLQYDNGESVQTYAIGDEIAIGTEKFNVISDNGNTVIMLAQYNLGTNYRQSTTVNPLTFSNNSGWEYTPGPKDINIQNFDGNSKTYVNEYVEYLRNLVGSLDINGDLITLKQLKSLGCTIDDNYASGSYNCNASSHKNWLANGQFWWTRSAVPSYDMLVWSVDSSGNLLDAALYSYSDLETIRPTITISKYVLENNIISFAMDGETYYARKGMYWSEWVNSEFNTGGFEIYLDEYNCRVYKGQNDLWLYNEYLGRDTEIIPNKDYVAYYFDESLRC